MIMSMLTYTDNAIEYKEVSPQNGTVRTQPYGIRDNYTVTGTTITSINEQNLLNAVEINWNAVDLPLDMNGNYTTIRTTADLLNYLAQMRTDINRILPNI